MPKSLSSYALYLLITVLIVCVYLGNFTGLNKLQWYLSDLMYSFRGEDTAAPDLVLVGIDDRSCETMGDWPWSYDVLADLVATCNSGEPKSILMNIDLSPRVSEDTAGRTEILANQVSWINQVVLTYDIALAEYSQQRISKPRYLHKSSIGTDTELGILKNEKVLNIRRPFLPSDIIAQYADGMGFTYLEFDKDLKVRWVPLVANYDGYCYPSATLITAAGYLGYGPDDIVVNSGRSISIGRHTVPTDEAGRLFVNYGKPGSAVTHYSAVDILEERIDPADLKDKLIIVGVTGSGATETYQTPVAKRMSRTEIMGNVIENITHDNYINRLNLSGGFNLLILLGFGAFCVAFLPRVTLLYRMVILFICLFILINLNFILFNSYNILTNSLYLGLEMILFMVASPLLDDSSRSKGGLGFFESLTSRIKKEEARPDSKQLPPIVPVREVRDTGQEQYFKETEHIETPPPASPAAEKPPAKIIGAPAETAAVDSAPSPAPEAKPSVPQPATGEELPDIMPPKRPEPQIAARPAGIDPASSPHSDSSTEIERITNLGRYQVIEIIGKGAMGTVFKGVDPAINRPVALKTIRLDFVNDPAEMEELRDRLAREARAAGKLSHPNIVTIYDIGSENNLHYIAMEYLEGQTLENLMNRKVQFSYKIIANIIAQICMGLQYAHEQGIVHRDIKPANIMVLPDYSVKVMDFGIARVDSSSMTRTGIAMGTPNYIAPELLQGKAVDRRCDIFSLGVVIYELLTGRRPFKGENLTSLIYSIINDNPQPPSSFNENLPLIFDHITAKALQKNPVERFQKASDIIGALSDFVGSFGGSKKVGL